MKIKGVNTFFGYGYYVLGAGKIIYFIILVLNTFTSINIALKGGYTNIGNNQGAAAILGIAELVLAVASFVLIFPNMSKELAISGGYGLGLLAILLEFILPSSILIFAIFSQCAMFMKAGQLIVENNVKLPDNYKPKQKYKVGNVNRTNTNTTPKEPLNNTDWFYMDSRTDNKEELRAKRFKEELEEWKKLLDSGDIDQETYDIETNKLIQKEQKRLREKNSRLM